MEWLELETVIDGGLCELDLCSVSEQLSHLTLFGRCWIARCKPHGRRVVWAERRGADSHSSRLKHSGSLKPCYCLELISISIGKNKQLRIRPTELLLHHHTCVFMCSKTANDSQIPVSYFLQGSDDDFETVYQQCVRCCKAFLEANSECLPWT